MRKKFKAWDNIAGKWRNDIYIDKDGDLFIDEGLYDAIGPNREISGAWASLVDIDIVWYSDWKDRNEKEICEGDILEDDYGRILLVEWHKSCFAFKALTETNFLRTRDIYQWFDPGEVLPIIIGNKQENPELLKGVKPQK